MARKYVVVVHGLMINNGTVVPYGTEVEEDVQVTDPERKVTNGFLLSRADYDKKVKADAQAVADASLSPEERASKADQQKAEAAKQAERVKAKEEAQEKSDKAHAELLDAYKKLFSSDAPDNATDEQIAKSVKDKIALNV